MSEYIPPALQELPAERWWCNQTAGLMPTIKLGVTATFKAQAQR
jgi:hypothetical protein